MTVPTADYQVEDEDYEAWCICGSKIAEWVVEKIKRMPVLYQDLAERYGDMIYDLLTESNATPGEDFWFEPYV